MEDQYEELANSPVLNEQGGMENSPGQGQPQHFPAAQPVAAPQGAPAPDWRSATGAPQGQVQPAPDWRNAPKQQEGSVWDSIKSNLGARADALAAGMLQDEGTDRSRYAMKRAERSNQEAALQESRLSTAQKVGVGAADIGTGLALAAIPGVGPEAAIGYFAAQGTADQLRQQAADTGRYDIAKASDVGIAQGLAAEATGGMAGQLVGRVAPRLAPSAIGRAATAITGGAGGGASMQMISNLANGKDAMEGVGEAAEMGAVGGLGAHAAVGAGSMATRAAIRAPRTLADIQGAGAAEAARRPNPIADAAARDNEAFAAQQPQAEPTVSAEEGALGGANPQPEGAIPADQAIPGSENLRDYGEGAQGAWNMVQPGTAMNASGGMPVGQAYKTAKGIKAIYKTITNGNSKDLLSPQKMADMDITAEKVGIKPGSRMVQNAKAMEGTVNHYQNELENVSPDSPEFQTISKGMVKLAMQHGSAAAAARANKLAEMTDMPMNSKFHDYELGEGQANQDNKYNVAIDEHGIPRSQIEKEQKAMEDAVEANSSLDKGTITEAQRQKGQSYEANFNQFRKAYHKGHDKMMASHEDNVRLARETLSSIKESENPVMYDKAQKLVRALDDYGSILTQSSNGKGLNTTRIEPIAHDIIANGTALGLAPKFKNTLGEVGSFHPVIDAEAWNNFTERTAKVHPNAIKGREEELGSTGFGFDKADIFKPLTLLKPAMKAVGNVANIKTATDSMARGAAMAKATRDVKTSRRSEEELNEAMKAGDVRSMEDFSKSALEDSGINTSGPDLAATPAQEVHPAAMEATAGQRAYLRSINHPRAEAPELTTGEADLHMTHDLAQKQAGPVVEPNPENVAGMAQRPTAPTSPQEDFAPIPEAEAQPAQEVAPEAPQGPGAFAENNVRPSALPETEVAPEPAQERTAKPIKAPSKLAPKEEPVVEPEPEVVPEPVKPKAEPIKAPRKLAPVEEVKPTTEEAEKPTREEPKPTEEVIEEAKIDAPIAEKDLDFKKGETSEQRNERVADMARRIVIKETEKTIKAPMKNTTLEAKKEAEGMNKGIKDALAHAEDVADKQGVEVADVITAMMSQKGGIKAVFKEGYGKDAIKGQLNKAVTAYKTEKRLLAQKHVDEAGQIVRKRLGEAKVGATKEAQDDRIRANLKAIGLEDKVIEKAFDRARGVTEAYTPRQVAAHARELLKEAKLAAKPVKPENTEGHIAKSRKALYDHIESLGVDSFTRSALRRVVANHTQTGKAGRPALTEKEHEAVINDMNDTLERRAKEAKDLITKAPKGSPAAVRASEKASKIESAAKQSKQTVGSLKSDLKAAETAQAEEATARQAAEKRAADAEANAAKMSEKLDNFVKKFEADRAEAIAEAKEQLRAEATGMSTSEVEQFGKYVGESLPENGVGRDSPEYQEWKIKMDMASEELRKRGLKEDAEFLSHFSGMVDRGLKRLEELPDRKDLTMSQEDYNKLRDLYNRVKKGGELDVNEAGNVQMGTMGIKMRTLLQGHSGAIRKLHSNVELKRERTKALHSKDAGDDGLDAGGIVVKPKRS